MSNAHLLSDFTNCLKCNLGVWIYKSFPKYFTEDIMKQIEEAVGKEFKYG